MKLACALVSILLASCGGPRREDVLERWIRVGVDPEREAGAVVRGLTLGGYRPTQRIEGDGFVALAFVREADGRRAVRVLTRIGVAVALDSHETDGVRVRHGAVRLVDPGVDDHDVDGDGRPEVVVARDDADGTCIAVIRIAEDGRASAPPIEIEEIARGRCASSLEDVDEDGRLEAMAQLTWPALALTDRETPSLRVALAARDGGWPAGAMPLGYEEREREARRAALAEARARLDVAAASRLGVELAALANLAGAPLASQAQRYDDALEGMVLREHERDRADAIRAYIASGWGVMPAEPAAN